jgi:hypothetical protein
MKKKKSMQRGSGNSSTNSHHPKKTVNVSIVVEGDNQSNENSLSQKQDIKYQQPLQTPTQVGEKPDEGLKEQLARSIKKLDLANDLATQKNVVLPSVLQTIPKSILDVKSSNDIRNLISHIENMVLEINKLLATPQTITSTPSTFTPTPSTPQTFTPTFSNTPNPFRYAQQPPGYTPYVPPPSYVAPVGTGPPPAYKPPTPAVDTKTNISDIPINPAGGGRRILQDYERQGDVLRDQTIIDVQSAIQRGDLPVLQNAYRELIQAENTLNQYIALEPRADVDQQIRAQIMDLDTYKNQLQTAITKAQQPPAQPPPQVTPIVEPVSDLVSKFNTLNSTFTNDVNTNDQEKLLILRTRVADLITQARDEDNTTIFQTLVGYDDMILEKLSMIPDQQPATPSPVEPAPQPPSPVQPPATPPPVEPTDSNEFVPYLEAEKRILEGYLSSKPSTTRPRSIQADSVITTRINNKINLINTAIQKRDLTDDEFDTAMARIPINNIKSWVPTRALVILKGESLKPGLNDTVELRMVDTPEGVTQLYKLYYNGTELTGLNKTETFFTRDGEVYSKQDITPPASGTNTDRQAKLNGLYTTGNPTTTEVAKVLKSQIENDTGSGTILDRANMNYPAAYAAIAVGVNDQRTVRTVALRPIDMTSFGGNSDQAFSLIVDGGVFKKDGQTQMFNRFGEKYTGVDYSGGYNPVLQYPYSTRQSSDQTTEAERLGSIFGFP